MKPLKVEMTEIDEFTMATLDITFRDFSKARLNLIYRLLEKKNLRNSGFLSASVTSEAAKVDLITYSI